VDLGIARDNLESLQKGVSAGLAADVLVLSGGVSAGKFDLVPQVLAEFRVSQVFHKISLRPGKPLWFGVREDDDQRTLVFGLPGNPVSSFVCFELFVRPAIAALSGRPFRGLRSVRAELAHAYQHPGGRAAFLPARLSAAIAPEQSGSATTITLLPWQGSADLAALAGANALVRLPAEPVALAVGDAVDALLI
jgi:molybdopterin molybdotransferase